MADTTIKVRISCNTKSFDATVRKMVLYVYKNAVGWRRFLIVEYWRVLLCLPSFKKPRG